LNVLTLNQNRKDLLATMVNQCWRLVSGPIMLLLIPLYLTPEQQGYWYLFGSIASLSMLADLGFSNIILQYSAHEYAFLKFSDEGLLIGEEAYIKRLGSILRFSIKWIATVCMIAFPAIYCAGIFFFMHDKVLGIYIFPWTLYVIGSLVNFFNNAILYFVQGLDKIAQMEKVRLIVSVLNIALIALILIFGGNIYALACAMLISSSAIFISFGRFWKFMAQLLKISKGVVFNWKRDLLPYFSHFGVCVLCGFFSLQIFTPLMHYFHGPVYSGKVGITITLVSAINGLANIWMYTIIPKINMLVANHAKEALDALFKKRCMLSVVTYIFITGGVFIFLKLFGNYWIIPRIASRFLTYPAIISLLVSYFVLMIENNWALYIRGHKHEAYMSVSIIATVLTVISTVLIGKYLSPQLFFTGFLAVRLILFPVDYMIFKRFRLAVSR